MTNNSRLVAHARAVAPLLLLALSSCATLTYVEPTTGSRARVRFATTSASISVLRSFGDDHCTTGEQEMLRLRNGPLARPEPKRLGMPLWDFNDNAAKEVYMPAGKQLNFLFGVNTASGGLAVAHFYFWTVRSTGIPFSVTFDGSKDYEIVLDEEQGKIRAYELAGARDRPVRVPMSVTLNENEGCLKAIARERTGG